MTDPTFKFDVSKLTVSDIIAYNQANQQGDIETLAAYLAKTCVVCPAELGDPKSPATFEEAEYGVFLDANGAFQDATTAAARRTDASDFEITASFRHIKAKDVSARFLKPLTGGDTDAVIKFLTEVITACPKAWGKPDKPETYLGLSQYGVFLPLLRQIQREARSPKKS